MTSSHSTWRIFFLSILAIFLAVSTSMGQTIIYVDDDAAAGGDGTSWATAYNDLQDALDVALVGNKIWVAAGVYKPSKQTDPTDPRTASFELISKVELYGGFVGNENPITFDLDNRDFATNKTILSGDLLGNDGVDFTNYDENSYHVVYSDAYGAATYIDGFMITAGNANHAEYPLRQAGGMYLQYGTAQIRNCTFAANTAVWAAGLDCESNSAELFNCTFENNLAESWCGALDSDVRDHIKLINCRFYNNFSEWSGGAINNLSPYITMINCEFVGNTALKGIGGAMIVQTGKLVDIRNCLFVANSASKGGAIHESITGDMRVTNCTFNNNTATQYGGAIYVSSRVDFTITNSVLYGNTSPKGHEIAVRSSGGVYIPILDVSYSDIQGGQEEIYIDGDPIVNWGEGNIDADPLFVSSNDFRLTGNSPCINAGNNDAVPIDLYTDMDGNSRIYGCFVDMGVYEFIYDTPLIFCSASSRRIHDTAGEFGIDLPVADVEAAGVECRIGGPVKVMMDFSKPIQAIDGTIDSNEVTLSVGTLGTVSNNRYRITVEMSNVPDESCLAIAVNGIVDLDGNSLAGDNDVHVRVLRGDSHPDGSN